MMALKCRNLNVIICEARCSDLSSAPARTVSHNEESVPVIQTDLHAKCVLSVRLSEDSKRSKIFQ